MSLGDQRDWRTVPSGRRTGGTLGLTVEESRRGETSLLGYALKIRSSFFLSD